MIIPFFIPHSGCPHQCVFCNQKHITGQSRQVTAADIPWTVKAYLGTNTSNDPVEIAFYGGSFTALPFHEQRSYLEAAVPFVRSGIVHRIRVSTRPDAINEKIISLLKQYHVETVELGAQSMDDEVLALSGRGHNAFDTVQAVMLLNKHHVTVGLQLMAGLPGDTRALFMNTVEKAIEQKPGFVRLYPVLVIKGTELEHRYTNGHYVPLALDDAIGWCCDAMRKFEGAGIAVVRIGLQPTEELQKPGTVIAGPYHPAFRQLVESSLLLENIRLALACGKIRSKSIVIRTNPASVSAAIGQKRSNIEVLKREFQLQDIRILPDENIFLRNITIFSA